MSDNQLQVSEALELHRAEKTVEGLAILDQVLDKDPTDKLALFVRGCLRVGNEDAQNAILDWETALEGSLQLAVALQEQHPALVEKAFYDFHFETTVEANDSSVHSALGRACRLFGRFDEAIVHLTRSSDLSRSAWRDAVLCAELQLKMGMSEAALANLNGILETRQDNAELHLLVGRLYQQQNSTAFALRHLERSVKLDAHEPQARLALGEIYLLQGRFDQAEPQLESALKMQPSARAHLGMAQCLRGVYRFDEALQHLRSAVELEPRNLLALSELGGLALQFGDHQLGVDCLKRALEIDPMRADIYGLLAKAAQQKGDAEQAIESYRQLLELSPNDSQAAHNLATLLAARGEYGEAAHFLEKVREVLRDDVQVTLDLAKCYLQKERRAEALVLLKQSFALHPNHIETRAALHELDPTAIPVDRTLTSFHSKAAEEHNPWLDAPDPTEMIGQPAAPAEEEPVTFESWVDKARALLGSGDEAGALKFFRAALALKPKDRNCLIETGRLYARRGLLGPAADLLQQGYSLLPGDFSLLPELLDCLARVDEMERDETLAGLVLSIPADLDRKELVNALYPLRANALMEELTDTIVQGLLSRFPSDLDCRTHWEALKAAPPAVELVVDPMENLAVSPGIELVTEPVAEEPAVMAEPVVEESAVMAEPVVEEPAMITEPVVEEPAAVAEPVVVEEPAAIAEPVAVEEPALIAEPVADEPTLIAEPAVEEPALIAEPVALELTAVAEPVADELTVVAEPVAEEPAVVAEPVAEEPAVVAEPVAEEPALVAEPVAEEPVLVAEPVAEEPALVAEPVAEEPALVAEPVAEEPALIVEPVALELAKEPMERVAEESAVVVEPVAEQPAVVAQPVAEESRAEESRPWVVGAAVTPLHAHWECWWARPGTGDPSVAHLYRELSWTLQRTGHLREAVLAMGQALLLEPTVGADWHSRLLEEWTEYLDALGQDSGALGVCRSWHELYPDNRRAANRLKELTPVPEVAVEAEVVCENLGQALEALRLYPGNEGLISTTLSLGDGHEDELLNMFRTLTRDHLDEPLHFRNFARVYLKLNKPILAVVQYQKYLVARPTAEGYRELAHAYTLLNREKNASEALKKAEDLATALQTL